MGSISSEVWFQLATGFLSTVITVATLVWFLAKMKTQFDLQIANVSHEIQLVQHTVSPYGSEIEKNRSKLLALTDRLTILESQHASQVRDIKRVEARQDRMQKI